MAQKKTTAQAVYEVAAPVAAAMGLQLWDVVFVKEGPSWFLRITIDKPGGVFMDDCEALSRTVDPLIEALDLTEHEYYLEVTSPGLARTLRKDAHLEAYMGKPIKIRLYQANENKERELFGTLAGYGVDAVELARETGTLPIPRDNIADIKADDDRDLFGGKKK